MDVYSQIEARYGFALPAEYRKMASQKFFTLEHPGECYDPATEPTYLWVPEAEWLRPDDILAYQPLEFYKPEFIPFATTGGDDYWCWWPEADPNAVVYCPRDEPMGMFDAPSLNGCIYRRFLQFAHGGIEEQDEQWARQVFEHWTVQLADIFPSVWIETLRSLARSEAVDGGEVTPGVVSLLSASDYDALIARDFDFPRMGEEFMWMRE